MILDELELKEKREMRKFGEVFEESEKSLEEELESLVEKMKEIENEYQS